MGREINPSPADNFNRPIFILPSCQSRHSSHREVTLSAIIIESTQENVNQFLNNCVALLRRPWNTNTVKNRVRLTYPICGVSEPHTTAYLHKSNLISDNIDIFLILLEGIKANHWFSLADIWINLNLTNIAS